MLRQRTGTSGLGDSGLSTDQNLGDTDPYVLQRFQRRPCCWRCSCRGREKPALEKSPFLGGGRKLFLRWRRGFPATWRRENLIGDCSMPAWPAHCTLAVSVNARRRRRGLMLSLPGDCQSIWRPACPSAHRSTASKIPYGTWCWFSGRPVAIATTLACPSSARMKHGQGRTDCNSASVIESLPCPYGPSPCMQM